MKKILFLILLIFILIYSFYSGKTSQNKNSISVDGSSSMEKLINILGEVFEQQNNVSILYNPTGSSAGIKSVIDNRTDIGLSSRNIKESELKNNIKSNTIAYDGIAIIVNSENNIKNLDINTLKDIFTKKITNWKEVGGSNSEIILIGREAGSGTRDGFESITNTVDECIYKQELTTNGDVVTSVSKNSNAIGYTSLANIKGNVNVLSIDNVMPNPTTIKNGSYKIQRPFNLITNNNVLSDDVNNFLKFIYSDYGRDLISKCGLIPIN